ncbi:GntR family transcriptional regulator [Paenibacillus yonginensis]|uniref:GntR family transcriptional regulator n=2 Tax=Paenibacillus yonginensis TaxID=1462996 RepID=A0A1B1MWF3_9BACL|nr:GntR family transcriptional regulator [Paenibacillus yonginensis]ANS73506.1 GntR family transcriptional regulator [Paenibacillus yonginensis]
MKEQRSATKRKNLLYRQVADKVRADITAKGMQPHEPVLSEGELAKLYGVSRMTAKLALELLVKEGLVYRLARRGTFVSGQTGNPEGNHNSSEGNNSSSEGNNSSFEENQRAALQQASGMKRRISSEQKRMALVFPNLDEYTARIIAAAEAEAREAGYQVLIRVSKDKDDESECLQELQDAGVDGIILYPRGRKTCSEKVLQLYLANYPIVVIDRIFREVRIDCVYHDHYQGAYQLTEYLIGKGHREIGYVSMAFDGVTSREDRYKGYLQAMLDHDLSINSHNIFLHCGEDYMDNLTALNRQLQAFLEESPGLTAVLCADDYLATSCLYTAFHMNKSVPDELSIVGFSDIQLASLLPVPLTTVRQTTDQLGQAAVKLLVKRINHSRENPITIKVNTSLVERSSVKQMSTD